MSFHSFRVAGFTLVEVLTVMAIIAILAVAALPSLTGLSKSGNVNVAGTQVENLLTLARQNSVSRNSLTAVVLLKGAGGSDPAYRTLTAFELTSREDGTALQTQDWVQVWKWEKLPLGVIVDASASTFTNQPAPAVSPNLPTIAHLGKSYSPGTDYAYQIFTPSGSLLSAPSPCTLILRPGFLEASGAVYQSTANFYSFTFNNENGEIKITRP